MHYKIFFYACIGMCTDVQNKTPAIQPVQQPFVDLDHSVPSFVLGSKLIDLEADVIDQINGFAVNHGGPTVEEIQAMDNYKSKYSKYIQKLNKEAVSALAKHKRSIAEQNIAENDDKPKDDIYANYKKIDNDAADNMFLLNFMVRKLQKLEDDASKIDQNQSQDEQIAQHNDILTQKAVLLQQYTSKANEFYETLYNTKLSIGKYIARGNYDLFVISEELIAMTQQQFQEA